MAKVLKGDPNANRILFVGARYDDPKHSRTHVTVLHIPRVVSPRTAVQAVRAQEYKNVTRAKKTKKLGRPKMAKGTAKGVYLRVRLTASELQAIEGAAKANGQTVSEWVRDKINAISQG